MALDVDKVRQKAGRLIGKQKLEQALKVYEDALGRDPAYPDLWCELASLRSRVGADAESGEAYFRAAEMYVQAGMDKHALAACKKAVDCGTTIPGARRLFNVLLSKVKGHESKNDARAKGSENKLRRSKLVERAAQGRMRLGRTTHTADDYDIDLTPLPEPLSTLAPIQVQQASDFRVEPTEELDLDRFEAAAGRPDHRRSPGARTAPPPPPVDYWDDDKPTDVDARPTKPRAPAPAAPSAPTFMILSRREPETLLGGLRTGTSNGLDAETLAGLGQGEARATGVLGLCPLMEGLSQELVEHYAREGARHRHLAGETFVASHEGPDALHVLLEGEARVLFGKETPEEIARLGAGAIIGEQSFVGAVGMRARVEAISDVDVLTLSRPLTEELFTDHPAALYSTLRVFEERLLSNMLARSGFFSLFGEADKETVCKAFEIVEVADDEAIAEQGTPSKTLCLLMSGTLQLSHADPDGQRVTILLDPGGVFGEESLIDGRASQFTARTKGRSWVMLLRRDDYLRLAEEFPRLKQRIKDVARRRRGALDLARRGELDLSGGWPDLEPG